MFPKLLTAGIIVSIHTLLSNFSVASSETPASLTTCTNGLTQRASDSDELRIKLGKARNLARITAEQINGGLSKYRTEAAMHGPAAEMPCLLKPDGALLFIIKGRQPASDVFTVETALIIEPNTWQVTVDYNGPIRSTEVKLQAKPRESFQDNSVASAKKLSFSRAKNRARQVAEEANGGLNNYRAEASMYQPSQNLRYKENQDNSWTFTFRGGRPGEALTVESVVTVSQDGSKVKVDYNGPIRFSP